MLRKIVDIFTSLKLTIVCLAAGMALIFAGTLAQVHLGIHEAQQRYFQSMFVWWPPEGRGFSIPIFPGGHLIGAVLLISHRCASKADNSYTALERFFRDTVLDQSVANGIPPAKFWNELAEKKKWTSAQLKKPQAVRGKLNVPRKRFRIGSAGDLFWAAQKRRAQ